MRYRRGDSRLMVGGEDHRGAPRNVPRDQVLHALHGRGVERRKRLVQDLIGDHVSRGAAVILTTHHEASITAGISLRIDLEGS